MIKTYKKECDYSYTLGAFLTIELLKFKPEHAFYVAVSSKADESEGVKKIRALCAKSNIPCETNDKQIEKVSPKQNCFAVGFFKKYECKLSSVDRQLVLVNPSDAGNLGTILRTAVGFNTPDIAIIKPAVDIFEPKTVRASMGAIFHANFKYFDSFEDYKKLGKRNFYPFMLTGAKPLPNLTLQKPYSLVFGNEGSGLPECFKDEGQTVIIPQSKLIDSLNLQTAVAIALYHCSNIK